MNKHDFLKLNVTYMVPTDANATDLMDDSSLLAGIVRDSLRAIATSIDTAGDESEITDQRGFCQLLYGLSYLADMGQNAGEAAQSILLAEINRRASK